MMVKAGFLRWQQVKYHKNLKWLIMENVSIFPKNTGFSDCKFLGLSVKIIPVFFSFFRQMNISVKLYLWVTSRNRKRCFDPLYHINLIWECPGPLCHSLITETRSCYHGQPSNLRTTCLHDIKCRLSQINEFLTSQQSFRKKKSAVVKML